MRIQARDTAQTAYLDDGDAGEGLSIFFSQALADTARWRLDVSARLDNGAEFLVGSFYVSPPSAVAPFDRLTRLVAIAVVPGAVSWSVLCQAQPGSQSAPDEDATIELFSSKCCTAPNGVTRVSERYKYLSNNGSQNVTLAPGQTVTRIYAVGNTGGGSIIINGGNPIILPAGQTIVLEPKAPIPANAVINFDTVDWTIELLESA